MKKYQFVYSATLMQIHAYI